MIRKRVALLWDIDGTLLSTNGLGRGPLLEAIQRTTGLVGSYDLESTSGFTDHQIVHTVLTQESMDSGQTVRLIDTVLDLYCELYSKLIYDKKFILLNYNVFKFCGFLTLNFLNSKLHNFNSYLAIFTS